MIRLMLILLISIMAAACASVPAYHPAVKAGDPGFSEQKIDESHYRVMFQG